MNKKELLNLPERKWNKESLYDSIVLVPTGRKHDSGWMLMAIVGIIDLKPREIAAYCDDICWKNVPIDGYSFRTDCYYPSGILHFWLREKFKFKVGVSLSSTDITIVHQEERKK